MGGSLQLLEKVHYRSKKEINQFYLLSVSKLTKDYDCLAIFDESHYVLQDMISRMTIGRARMINCL